MPNTVIHASYRFFPFRPHNSLFVIPICQMRKLRLWKVTHKVRQPQQAGRIPAHTPRTGWARPFFCLASSTVFSCNRGHAFGASRPGLALGDRRWVCRAVTVSGWFHLHLFLHFILSMMSWSRHQVLFPFCTWGKLTFKWSNVSQMLTGPTSNPRRSALTRHAPVHQHFPTWTFYITNEDTWLLLEEMKGPTCTSPLPPGCSRLDHSAGCPFHRARPWPCGCARPHSLLCSLAGHLDLGSIWPAVPA